MALFLRVSDGRLSPQVFRLDDPSRLRVGRRHDCDIPLQERSVSRRHCILNVHDGCILVTDTLSRNGVWIDAQRLTGSGEAGPGASIRLAGARLEVMDSPSISAEGLDYGRSPRRVIGYLPGQGSSRKLRLIACAWYRHVIGVFPNERMERLAELAEQHADGLVSGEELARERDDAQRFFLEATLPPACAQGAICLAAPAPRDAADSLLRSLAGFAEMGDVAKLMTALARDVLGDFFNPFHPLDEWLEWNDRTLVKMARLVYEKRDFAALPVVGDALEDAGCCNEEVLRHCRTGQPHTRGCWVLDSILGMPRPRILDPGPEVTTGAH